MSLINKMLQDLDERRPEGTTGPVFHAQIRAVPESEGLHPAWWVVIGLIALIIGFAAWLWRHQSYLKAKAVPPLILQAQLPLKLAPSLTSMPPDPHERSGVLQQPAAVPEAEKALPKIVELKKEVGQQGRATDPDLTRSRLVLPLATAMAEVPPTSMKDKTVPSKASAPSLPDSISSIPAKQIKELTQQQRAENEYRSAASLMQQSRSAEAMSALEQALVLDPKHVAARQTLVGLLLDTKRPDEAMRRAREGLNVDVSQVGLAMIVARLQIDKGELEPALVTLQRSATYAGDRADYQSFLAALLQRAERHKDAVTHYLIAVRKAPQNGVWWMGLGISLQAESRDPEAQEAFGRAKASGSLSPELQAFVEQRLAQLQR